MFFRCHETRIGCVGGNRGARSLAAHVRCTPRLRIAAAAAVLAAGLVPVAAAAASHRHSRPAERLLVRGLYPSFSSAIHDYVVRCGAGGRLKLDLDAGIKGGTVAVTDGRRIWRTGRLKLSLAAGQELSVTFDRSGRVERYYVRCLPHDFPAFTFKAYVHLPRVYYLAAPITLNPGRYYVVVFDSHGVPVWWMKSRVPYDQQAFPDHRIGWWAPSARSNPAYVVRDLSGKVVHRWRASSSTDPHEFQLLPNGDALLAGDVARPGTVNLSAYGGPATGGTLWEPVIEEVSRSGRVVWSWNAGRRFSTRDTDPAFWPDLVTDDRTRLPDGRTAYFYAHLNSIQQLPDGKTLIVSFRDMSAVYAIDKRSGRILWKLGGNPSPRSLKVIGDPQGQHPFSGQHDARILPDGTLTVHDNNSFDGYPPRAVRYRINRRNMTARLIHQQTDPLAQVPSGIWGSAEIEPGGSWLISWGQNPLITAFSPAGKRLFALIFGPGYASYRAQEVPNSWLPIAQLRAGMNRIASRSISSDRRSAPPVRRTRTTADA